jgi:pimeloyl-ACP methyl ester carboxylesterase
VLQQALPDSRTVRLPRCGHQLMAEQPEGVLKALTDFLNPLREPAKT